MSQGEPMGNQPTKLSFGELIEQYAEQPEIIKDALTKVFAGVAWAQGALEHMLAYMRAHAEYPSNFHGIVDAFGDLSDLLMKAVEFYPADAESMSLDEYLDAHPDTLEKAVSAVIGAKGAATAAQPAAKRKQASKRTAKEIAESMAANAPERDGKPSAAQTAEIYYLLAQSKTSNALQKILTERITSPAQLDLYGNAQIIGKDFKLFIDGYRELERGVSQSAARLLDCLMITATREGLKDTLVKLPLREYMDMRGLRDEKAAREQAKQDVRALAGIRFEYKGTGKRRNAWISVALAGEVVGQKKDGDIWFRFSQAYFDSFKHSESGRYMFMYFPHEALRMNINSNPYTYWLARKIAEHKRMNLGKPNEDVIGVQTLLGACPNYPTYAEVMAGDGAINRRIIEPFERDMDALNTSLKWNYADTEPPKDHASFMAAMVSISWKDYPDAKKLIAKKEQRIEKEQKSDGKPTAARPKKQQK
jgi:hypothetical protein